MRVAFAIIVGFAVVLMVIIFGAVHQAVQRSHAASECIETGGRWIEWSCTDSTTSQHFEGDRIVHVTERSCQQLCFRPVPP